MPKKVRERLYFVLNKKNLNEDFYKKNKNVFTLNKFILTDQERKEINHFYPNPYKTSNKAGDLLKRTIQTKKEIIDNFSDFGPHIGRHDLAELLDTFLELKLSSYFYLITVIPSFDEYLLINKKDIFRFKSKSELVIAINKISSQSKENSLFFSNKFSKLKESSLNSLILKIQKIFLSKIAKKNNDKKIIFLSCKKAYFHNYLSSKFKQNNDFIIYYHSTTNIFRTILILLDQGVKYIFRKEFKQVGIALMPLSKNSIKVIQTNYFKDFNYTFLDLNYAQKIQEEVSTYFSNYKYISKYLNKCMKGLNVKDAYFHTIRMPDLFSFSRTLTNLDCKVYLISHGSHTVQRKGGVDEAASKNLGLGLCYTNQNKIELLSQSIYCDEFLDSLNKDYKKINFLINKKVKINNITVEGKNKKTKILYVGTVKGLGARRYYYESSSEFIGSIYEIYSKLKKFNKKFVMYLNIRDVNNEINEDILQNAFNPLNDLIQIRRNLSLENEIENSDCVISYSSTVLEEALEKHKPVMCYGLPKYNHFKNYEKRNSDKKLKVREDLKIIEDQLNRKFIFNSNIKRILDYKF